jgi:regulator of sigma E protease
MSFVIAIAGLAFLILIHEAGHFFTSLAVGMRPRKFYVGFPPAILKTKRNGIEYAIGAIPLGGYVKIPGMHRPAAKDVDVVFSRALHANPELVGPAERLKRALAIEDFAGAKVALEDFRARAEAVGAPHVEKPIQDLEDALSPTAYWRAPTWKRVAAIAAGPLTNFAFAIVLFAIVFMVAGANATTKVERVVSGSQAAAAGLQSGDRVVAINGQIVQAKDITTDINGSQGKPVTLTVFRDGKIITLRAERPEKGADGRYRLGFQLKGEPLGFGPAVWQSLKTTGVVARQTATALGGIFHSKERRQLSGTVGIVKGTTDAVHYGWLSYLSVLALISLALALFNLLPLLPLDGGHIAFSLLEAIRGRAIAREVYERASAVGIAVVLLLFFVGLSNDVGRLGGG